MRLIDADALIDSIRECVEAVHDNYESDMEQGYLNAIECVEEQPTVEAEPVRHGKWIEYPTADGMNQCSECGVLRFGESNYCPNCGARMDAE